MTYRRRKGPEMAPEVLTLPADARFPAGALIPHKNNLGAPCTMDPLECYGLPPMPESPASVPANLTIYDGDDA